MLFEAMEIRNEEILHSINVALCGNSLVKPETYKEIRESYVTSRMQEMMEEVTIEQSEAERKIIFQNLKKLQR